MHLDFTLVLDVLLRLDGRPQARRVIGILPGVSNVSYLRFDVGFRVFLQSFEQSDNAAVTLDF